MASNTTLIRKLQQALNMKGYKILYSTSQFYSEDQNRPVTVYHIKRVVYDDKKEKKSVVELYKSASQIRILLFLRDMWYEVNGWEIPQNNVKWDEVKNKPMNYIED